MIEPAPNSLVSNCLCQQMVEKKKSKNWEWKFAHLYSIKTEGCFHLALDSNATFESSFKPSTETCNLFDVY